MAEPPVVGSPDWWVVRLYQKLQTKRVDVQRFEDYYRGAHPLPEAPVRQQREYLKALQRSRSNFMRLVIDAKSQRLHVQGIRLGDSDSGDLDSWKRLWQPNNLDAYSEQVHTAAYYTGTSYVSVWNNPDDETTPLITPEHPFQTLVECVPGQPRRRAAGLKVYVDDWTGSEFATLFLPDKLYKYKRTSTSNQTGLGAVSMVRNMAAATAWVLRDDVEDAVQDNPLGVVPLVPFRNKPGLTGAGVSELQDLTSIQDRINTTVFRRSMAEWLSAYRQKWITGFKVQQDENGQPIRPFDPGLDTLWVAEDPAANFGDFAEHTLDNYTGSMTSDIHAMAAISQVPSHYLINTTGQPASGDSLKAAEAGLIASVKAQLPIFSGDWEEVISLGWQVLDDPRGKITDAEMLWDDPEFRTEGEKTDAIIKRLASGLCTLRQAREDYGYSPQQIERMEADDQKAALQKAATANLFAPPAGAAPPPQGNEPPSPDGMPMSYRTAPGLTPNDKSMGS